MSKRTAQIIAENEDLSKLLSEMFLWIGRPHSVNRVVTELRDKLQDEHEITFEIYT